MKPFFTLFAGLVLLLNAELARSQIRSLGFTHYRTSEGLSHSNVLCILQDHQGFMWFGTIDGLNKFDGYRFTVYKKNPAVASSIVNNHIAAIEEDKAGNIWLATRGGGLDMLDRDRKAFVHYQHDESNPKSLSSNFTSDLIIDSEGYIWVTTDKGLNRFDPRTKQFTRFVPDTTKPGRINDSFIRCVMEDAQHRIWVGTERGGLNLFDRKTQSFTNFQHHSTDGKTPEITTISAILEDDAHRLWVGTLGGGLAVFDPATRQLTPYTKQDDPGTGVVRSDVLSLAKDRRGNIWIGTENNGLAILNPDVGVLTNYQHDEIDQSSLSNNSVYAIRCDATGNMWLGVYAGGINLVNQDVTKFPHYKHTAVKNTLNNNSVLTFFEDSDRQVWIGTDGGGMSLFDLRRETFTPFTHDKNQPNSLGGNYVLSITEDHRKNLWIGMWDDGLSVYDKARKRFKHYRNSAQDPTSLSSNKVYSVLTDRDKTIWAATWDKGLNRYDSTINGFRHYKHDPANLNSLASNSLQHIIQDRRGYIWIATFNAGVDRLDPKRQRFAHFTHHYGVNSLSNNNVTFLYEDRAGIIWMATASGLSGYNPVTNQFTNYSTEDGLPNDVISGIQEDGVGNFWISTNGGLSLFNPRSRYFRNFTNADGLQSGEFKPHACLRSRSGLMYFGGINGFNVFKPSAIQVSNFDPPLLFTSLSVFNREVPVALNPDDDSPLKQLISETKALTLPYRSSVITLDFASLNYTIALKKRYAYRLIGFDKDWNYVGTTHTATYTNLDPGEYTFEVKGLTNQGQWSVRRLVLLITIEAPFWLTWWFKLLVLGLLVGSIWGGYRWRINAVNAQKKVLEQIIVERTERLQQEQTLNKMKSQFVSTASHEFRTPLATIQSSVDLVTMYLDTMQLDVHSENKRTGIQKHLTIIEKEIDKFGDLLNDVLSIEKMSAGKVAFRPQLIDITQVYAGIITSHFGSRKDQREVTVSVTGTPRPVLLDEKLISHALTNLLSNAFKYSATNPVLQVDFGEKHLVLSVVDEGMGIPRQDLPNLFESFYRAGNVSTIQGTGLGLFIARQFVELHGGSIRVESQENVGTTFSITLPAEPSMVVWQTSQPHPASAT